MNQIMDIFLLLPPSIPFYRHVCVQIVFVKMSQLFSHCPFIRPNQTNHTHLYSFAFAFVISATYKMNTFV